jgi:hypothetical protein
VQISGKRVSSTASSKTAKASHRKKILIAVALITIAALSLGSNALLYYFDSFQLNIVGAPAPAE